MVKRMAKRSAGKRSSAKRSTRAAAPDPSLPPRERAISALMQLLAEHPWIEIEISDIAERAGMTLGELREEFSSPLAILAAHMQAIDRQVLDAGTPDDAEMTPRERLFEVLMRRLEALAPHKEAIRSLMHSVRRNPPLALALNGLAVRSQHWMLTAAGISAHGPKGMIRAQGLAVMFAQVVGVWLDDDESGLDRTMAALDRGLTSGQRWSGLLDDLMCLPGALLRRGRRYRRHRRADEAYDDDIAAA